MVFPTFFNLSLNLAIYLGQTLVEVMKVMVTSFKRSHAFTATLSAPNPAAGCHLHWRLLDTHRQVWVRLLWGHCSFLLGPSAQCSVCALQESFSQSCVKFWQLYGGVNDNLLQEGLCHTQVCCTQSPCPTADPYLHRRRSDTVLSQSLRGSLGPGVHKVCLSPLRVSGGNGV